jgi:flagellar biosynthesis protein FlhG
MRLTRTPSWLTQGQRRRQTEDREHTPPFGRKVWAIGGGKGGIGKTFLAANVAAVAARSGRNVVLVDLDLGGANLHTALGVRGGERVNLSDYLDDRVVDLEKTAVETPIPKLRLIVGALGHVGAAETTRAQRSELLRALRELSADLVILDLAAGTQRSTLDFFLVSDESLVVTTPEPTAVENAYGFLRSAFYRRMAQTMSASPVRDLVRESMNSRNERGIRTPHDLLDEIEKIDSEEGARFRRSLDEFRPRLIVNEVRNSDDVKLGFSIQSVCRKYFGFGIDYVGYVNFDDAVWQSIKSRRPLVVSYPQSDGSLYIRRIVKKILEA